MVSIAFEKNTPEQALERWGAWARRGSAPSGWLPASPVRRALEGPRQRWRSAVDDDHQALEVDRLVGSLPRELRRMLVLHYTEPGDLEDKAAEMQVSVAAYERALSQARAAFSGLLN